MFLAKNRFKIVYISCLTALSIYVIIQTLLNVKYWDTQVFSEFAVLFPNPYVFFTENEVTFLKVAYLPHFALLYRPLTIFDVKFQYLFIAISSILCSFSIFYTQKNSPSLSFYNVIILCFLPVAQYSFLEFGNIEGILFWAHHWVFIYLLNHRDLNNENPKKELIVSFVLALITIKIYTIVWVMLYLPLLRQKGRFVATYVLFLFVFIVPLMMISENIRINFINIFLFNPVSNISTIRSERFGVFSYIFPWVVRISFIVPLLYFLICFVKYLQRLRTDESNILRTIFSDFLIKSDTITQTFYL
jgi:hypothetical protein